LLRRMRERDRSRSARIPVERGNNPDHDTYVSPRVFCWTASRVLPCRNPGTGIPDPSARSIRKGDSGKAEVAQAGFENAFSSPSQRANRNARQVETDRILQPLDPKALYLTIVTTGGRLKSPAQDSKAKDCCPLERSSKKGGKIDLVDLDVAGL